MLVPFTVSPALKLGPPFPAIRDCVGNISAVANRKVFTLFATGNLVVYIIIIIIIIIIVVVVSCHRTLHLEPTVSPTAKASSFRTFRLQNVPYYL
jgi:hypothetical protein